ncbi:hypothetical protein ALI22I_02765 [Saccharothrix sp. ALI-22-I]|uniref:Crp/Fnr family transcriptional regulator n=1 Tax=Saccharothrix sp. ALI-22-I TaxID=1933778 RepID=UPI00097CAE5B|nr:Crp/Fnr family transcriptional regulator [Saccharothrix sp. ALI-22-I]ONI92612.1 hypothetical protein ALI22I_02765 [Saccharothrix sp. ALI-22-I]
MRGKLDWGLEMSDDRPRRGLLGRLSPPAARALLDSGSPVGYGPGDVLMRQGADDGHAVLLLTGAVKVQAIDESVPALLGVRSAGDLVGEMAALDDKPRSATVIACGRVAARLIRRHQLRAVLDRHHELLVELARVSADQIRWANDLCRAMSRPAATRIAQVLVHLAHHHGDRSPD